MPAPVLSGPQYLREGLTLVLSPGLRLFVLLPLLINLVLFVGPERTGAGKVCSEQW